jgi:uncharacterized protein YggU (UPF0235/DUF167 family)
VSTRVAVRLTPRAAFDRVDGLDEAEVLHCRVTAPPVGGAANEALCRLLARELGLRPSAVRVVTGLGARRKVVEIEGGAATPIAAWPRLRPAGS